MKHGVIFGVSANRVVACIVVMSLALLASASAVAGPVSLTNGTTFDGQLIGFFTHDGVDYFVFALTDGSLAAHSRSEIAVIVVSGTAPAPATGVSDHATPQTTSSNSGSSTPASPSAQGPSTPTAPVSAQPQSGAYVGTEIEPNNDIVSANPIALGRDVTGAIDKDGDVDVFKVTVTTHGTFRVTCTQPADFYVSILDSSGKEIYGGDHGGVGDIINFSCDVFAPGDYYVLVRGYGASCKSATAYTMNAQFRSAYDGLEPNDAPEKASPVISGREFDSFIYKPKDVDYYRIDIAGPTTIQVNSTQPADFYLAVVGPDGKTELAGGDLGSQGNDMSLTCDVFAPGSYYVMIRGYNDSIYSMHDPYRMRITVTPGKPDRFEPNDTSASASVPPFGQPFQACISRPGDIDYYRLDIAGPSRIEVQSDQPADYYLAILGPDGKTELAGGDFSSAGNEMKAVSDVFNAGIYYVAMRGYASSCYNMHVPYNMTIRVTPAVSDPAEPNNSADQAKQVVLGQKAYGVIDSSTDRDWWYFDAPLLGKVRITCTQPGDFVLKVLDAMGKEVLSEDLGSNGVLMDTTFQPLPMMRYYVVIAPYGSSGYNMFERYELTVQSVR